MLFYCNAEAAGFEPANRLRAVNCFRGRLLQPLGHASYYFIGTLSQALTLRAAFTSSTYLLSQIPGPGRSSDDDLLNSPDPVFKGAIRACGLSIAACLPCSPTPARHLKMPCYFIAAFASSTYLLSQIPGPGRSSDDDLLNPPNPLFKGAIRACGLSIAAVPSLLASSGPASDDALLVPLICKNYLSVIPFSTVLSISPGRAASPDSILLP